MECPRRLRNASPLHGRQRTHREGYLGLADARIGARSVRAAVLASVLLSDAGRERAEGTEGPRLSHRAILYQIAIGSHPASAVLFDPPRNTGQKFSYSPWNLSHFVGLITYLGARWLFRPRPSANHRPPSFLLGRCTMSDALYRAERCRDLAEECRRVAAISASTEMRNHYSRMSEHYSTLAEAE